MAEGDDDVTVRVEGEDHLSEPVGRGRRSLEELSLQIAETRRQLEELIVAEDAAGRSSRRYESQLRGANGRWISTRGLTEDQINALRNLGRVTDEVTESTEELGGGLDDLAPRQKRHRVLTDDQTKSLDKLAKGFNKVGSNAFLGFMSKAILIVPVVQNALGFLVAGTNALAAGTIAATSALAPMTGLLAAYPSLFLAGAQGMGVFKLATAGVGQAISDLVAGTTSKAGMAALQKALAGLSPQARIFAQSMAYLENGPIKALKQDLQQSLFGGVNIGLHDAIALLPMVTRGLQTTAMVLGDLAADAGHLTQDPFFRGELSRIMGVNSEFLANAGQGALHFVHALFAVVDAFRPVTRQIGIAIKLAGQWSDAAATNADATGRLTAFFWRAWTIAKSVAGVLANLAVAFFNIGRLSVGLGNDMGASIAGVAAHFRAWTESARGQNHIRKYFSDAKPIIYALGELIRSIVDGFSKLSNSPALAKFLTVLRTQLGPALSDFIKQGENSNVLSGIVSILPSILGLASAFGQLGPAASIIGTLARFINGLVHGFLSLPRGVQKTVIWVLAFAGAGLKLLGVGIKLYELAEVFNAIRLGIIGATIATNAGKDATAAYAIGAKLAAAAQWIWNVALDANPFGLIVLAIGLAIIGVVLLYKHSATFRAIVADAGRVAVAVFRAIWDWMKTVGASAAQSGQQIARGFMIAVNFTKGIFWDLIHNIVHNWDEMGHSITTNWHNVIGWITDHLRAGVSDIKNVVHSIGGFFDSMGDHIRGVWDDVVSAGKAAFDQMLRFLNDTVIGSINSVIKAFNYLPGPNIPTISPLPMLYNGGTVQAGSRAIVGEIGPEAFVTASGIIQMVGTNGPQIVTFPANGVVLPTPVVNASIESGIPLSGFAHTGGAGGSGAHTYTAQTTTASAAGTTISNDGDVYVTINAAPSHSAEDIGRIVVDRIRAERRNSRERNTGSPRF